MRSLQGLKLVRIGSALFFLIGEFHHNDCWQLLVLICNPLQRTVHWL